MSLLHQIQVSVVQEGSDLGSVLLKLRLLASRLGSDILEEWVKHESEGYPKETAVPSYRVVGVRYTGTFFGPSGSGIRNAQIPSSLIQKYAGERWANHEIRESIAVIGDLVKKSADSGSVGIDASNLILLLQGKVYENYACNDISASISPSSLAEIEHTVRNKILELTLELEKTSPEAVRVTFGTHGNEDTNSERVQQISHQIIYGNVTTAVAGGHNSSIILAISKSDNESFIESLVNLGVPRKAVTELVEIMETEVPSSTDEPFGQKAKSWLASNLKKTTKGALDMGTTVATRVLIEAALRYYGLK